MDNKQALVSWFNQLVDAVIKQNSQWLLQRYALPCLLSQPDTTQLINSQQALESMIEQMLTVLVELGVCRADVALKTVTPALGNNWFVQAHWQLLSVDDQLMTEFNTVYQLVVCESDFKIISVTSF